MEDVIVPRPLDFKDLKDLKRRHKKDYLDLALIKLGKQSRGDQSQSVSQKINVFRQRCE